MHISGLLLPVPARISSLPVLVAAWRWWLPLFAIKVMGGQVELSGAWELRGRCVEFVLSCRTSVGESSTFYRREVSRSSGHNQDSIKSEN